MIFYHFQLFLAIFTKSVGDEAEYAVNFERIKIHKKHICDIPGN